MKQKFKQRLLLWLLMLLALPAVAEEFKVGNYLYYKVLTDNTVEVVAPPSSDTVAAKYRSTAKDITVPETVTNGDKTYTVTGVGSSAFASLTRLSTVHLPNTLTYIGNYAFKECSALQYFVVTGEEDYYYYSLPESLTSIGEYAFWGTRPHELHMPDGVTKIPKGCFLNAVSYYLTLPGNLKTIENNAFQGAKFYPAPTIPASVESIDATAFTNCSLDSIVMQGSTPPTLTYSSNTTTTFMSASINKISVPYGSSSAYSSKWSTQSSTFAERDKEYLSGGIQYNPTGDNTMEVIHRTDKWNDYVGDIVIPETVTIDGTTYTVTGVGENAFHKYSSDVYVSITLPKTITKIGKSAFYRSRATSLKLPEALTEIGDSAFAESRLSDIVLPEGVKTIGNYVFYNSGATHVVIPTTVETIGEGIFYSAQHLDSVDVLKITPPTMSGSPIDKNTGADVKIYVPSKTKDLYAAAAVWKDVAVKIVERPEVFDYEGVKYSTLTSTTAKVVAGGKYTGDITLPEQAVSFQTPYTVVAVDDNAFSECTGLTGLTMSSTVMAVGAQAFKGCTSLANVAAPNVTDSIGRAAFAGCEALAKVSVAANGITAIADSTFTGCKALTAFDLPTSVVTIGQYAFSGAGLKTVPVSETVTNVNDYAFAACAQLTYAKIFPKVTEIKPYTFYGTALTSISLPAEVTSVGDYAFAACGSLADVTIEDSETALACPLSAFLNAPLTSLYLGRNLTYDRNSLQGKSSPFSNVTTLESVTVGDKVTALTQYSFCQNTALVSVTLGSALTTIGIYAFAGCTAITTVAMPATLTTVGQYAFSGCTSLKGITLPATTTSVGGNAFKDCGAIEYLVIEATTPPTISSGTTEFPGTYQIFVPSDVLNTYTSATNWSEYAARLTANSDYFVVDGIRYMIWDKNKHTLQVLEYLSDQMNEKSSQYNKESMTIPDKVTYHGVTYTVKLIGKKAFRYCTALQSITLPDTVTTILEQAFEFCTALTSIDMPKAAKFLDNWSFRGCKKLAKVDMGNSSVVTISKGAFMDCKALTEITIPSTVTQIQDSAFYDCTNLERINMLPMTPPALYTSLFISGVDTYEQFKATFNPFRNISNVAKIYVDVAAYDKYAAYARGEQENKIYASWENNGTLLTANHSRSITSEMGNGITLCLPYNATIPTGVTPYKLTEVDPDNKIAMEKVTNYIPAHTPVLVMSDADGEYEFVSRTSGTSVTSTSSTPTAGVLTGVYEKMQPAAGKYILTYENGSLAFRKTTGTNNVAVYRAYLTVPDDETAAAKMLMLDFDFTPTAVDAVSTSEAGTGEPRYNMAGQRVSNAAKGLVITNGKKYYIK